jgi:uncharacterized protein (TIGR00266 family)
MHYQIEHGPAYATLIVKLNTGESLRAEAGAMLSMTSNINLEAKSAGKGFLGSIKAAVSGESFFASLFTAQNGEGEVILAPSSSGDIIKMELNGNTIFAEGGAYLAGSPDLEISTKGSFKALIAGEGLFLQKISGRGTLFLSSYGSIIERTVTPGNNLIIDTGHLVAFEETLSYSIKKVSKGLFSTLASGEGLVSEFTGSGKVWIQTRNLKACVGLIERFLPNRSN